MPSARSDWRGPSGSALLISPASDEKPREIRCSKGAEALKVSQKTRYMMRAKIGTPR